MKDADPNAVPQAAVVVERAYRAPVEDLWALWTTKAGFESWWGPVGFRVDVHDMDAREGGAFSYDMIADTPETIAAMRNLGRPASHGTRGWFSRFEPHRRLRLTHVIDFIPEVEPYETMIDVDFHLAGDRTRMVVTLHPHLDPHWTRMSATGFASQITRLDKRYGWTGE